jgi:hypothetical protein
MQKVYQLPIGGVFMTESGTLQTTVLPDQVVVAYDDPTAIFQPEVKLTIAGVELQTYAANDSSPNLANVFGLSKDVKDALSFAAQAASVISTTVGVVSAVITALKLMGFLDEEDPYNALFNRIDQKLQVILKATLAGSTLATMQNVRSLVGHSETAAAIAIEHIKSGYPTDALAVQSLGTADYWSRYAVTTLSGEAYWMRVYDEEALKDPAASPPWQWQTGIKERAPINAGLVWDYRFALPAWLKALTARLGVIKAMDPNHNNPRYRNEILSYAKFTRFIEGRIRAGIAKAVLPIGEEQYPFFAKFNAQPSGAADIYTGLSDYVLWSPWEPSDEIEMLEYQLRGGPPNNFQEYKSQHESLNESRFWRVYRWIGMFAFWQITPDLETLAAKFTEQPPLAVPINPWVKEQLLGTHSGFIQRYSNSVIREAFQS